MIVNVSDTSGVGEVRRASCDLAKKIGFNEEDVGRVSIVATEAATNIFKHAKSGAVIIQILAAQTSRTGAGIPAGIEILASDQGPGHHDIESCMRDGYSTAGTAGNGLGAMKRLADHFDIYSAKGIGTIVMARLWPAHQAAKIDAVETLVGSVADVYPGETVCGDAWSYQANSERCVILLADGLGHGVTAYEAAAEAVRIFTGAASKGVADIIEAVHLGIRHTRGCAVSAGEVDWERELVTFCGAGNVSGCVLGLNKPKRSMISMNGTAGFNLRKTKDFSYPFETGSILVMHSDGIDTHWDLSEFPHIARHHPAIIAAAIFSRHRRVRDDATVVVARKAERK